MNFKLLILIKESFNYVKTHRLTSATPSVR